MSIIGDNLRSLRETLGMSRGAVGRAIGHGNGRYISAIELGQKHPSPEMLARIAQALHVQPEDLRKPPASLASAQTSWALGYTRRTYGAA